MLNNKKCNKCQNVYDNALNECPNCHEPNMDQNPSFKNMQMLSLPKQIALFVMGLGGLELVAFIVAFIFNATGIISWNESLVDMLFETICYSITAICLFAILNKDTLKLAKSFKKLRPIIAGLVCCLAIFAFNFIYSLILSLTGAPISIGQNQGDIDKTAMSFPFTSLIIFGIVGPICEEITYRVGLFSFLKRVSKWVAYPITMLVFALIHFGFTSGNLVNELLNLPFYLFAAFALTYTYDKYGFAGSLTAHLLNNVISLIPFAVAVGVFH